MNWLYFDAATLLVGIGIGAGGMWWAKSPDQVKEDIQYIKNEIETIKAKINPPAQ